MNKCLRIFTSDSKLDNFVPAILKLKWILDANQGKTACTNGYKVWVNPEYWDYNNTAQKNGLILHEALHPLWLHIWRFKDCGNHNLSNYACDVQVNRFIKALSKLTHNIELPANPPGGMIVNDESFGDLSEEGIYNKILSDKDDEEGDKDGEDEDEGDESGDESGDQTDYSEDGEEGEGDGGDSDEDGDEEGDGKGDGKGKGKEDPMEGFDSPGGFRAPTEEEDKEAAAERAEEEGIERSDLDISPEVLQRKEWQEVQQKIAQVSRLRGNLPGGFIEQLEQTKADVPWAGMLRQFMQNLVNDDYSDEFFDRRFISEGIYTEALDNPSIQQGIIAKDTSGSMMTSWLAKSCSEINYLRQQVKIKETYVLDIDSAIHATGEGIECYGPRDDIEMTAKGRGGTDFRPPFEWVEKHLQQKPDFLIYFTDGWGPFPETEPPYPVLWVTFGLDPEDYPFGGVIDLRSWVG